jgi:hypothetical protein
VRPGAEVETVSGRDPRQVLASSIVSMRWSLLRPALLAALAIGVMVVLGLHIVQPLPGLDVQDGYWPWPLGLMAYPVAAYLLLSRRPDNRIGHVLGLVALFSGLIFLSHWTAVTFTALSAASELLTWVGSRGQLGALAALLHLFPTGHPLGARHRRLLNGLTVGLVAATAVGVLSPMPLMLSGETNPHAVLPATATVAVDLSDLLLAAFAGSGLVALVLRRLASVLVRMQLRWFVGAACIALLFLVLEGLAEIPGSPLAVLTKPAPGGPVAEVLSSALFAAGLFWGLPAAIVVAVTRYRLYEIDRLVSRTVSYTLLVGVLLAIYAAGVLALHSLVPASGDLVVAASTLAVVTVFRPLRTRTMRFVDHRFNRASYLAEQTRAAFAKQVRESLDQDAIVGALVDVVRATLQPATSSLWFVASAEPQTGKEP